MSRTKEGDEGLFLQYLQFYKVSDICLLVTYPMGRNHFWQSTIIIFILTCICTKFFSVFIIWTMMWIYQKLIPLQFWNFSLQMILPPCDLNKSFHLCLLGESSVLKISFEQRILDNTATDFLPFFGTDIGFCRLEDNSNFQPRIDNSTHFFLPQSNISNSLRSNKILICKLVVSVTRLHLSIRILFDWDRKNVNLDFSDVWADVFSPQVNSA